MHIALVCREYIGSCRAGGIGSYIHEIARAYVHKGHKVTIVTASDDTRTEREIIMPDGIRVISLSGGDFLIPQIEGASKTKKLRCIYRFKSYRRKLANVLKDRTDIDIVEVADYGAEGLYLDRIGKPVVVRLHTPQALSIYTYGKVRPKWWHFHHRIPIEAEKRIFARAHYITGCSNAILNWVKNNYNISNAMTAVIENPLSSLQYVPETLESHSKSKKIIFYAGTISETKGVNDLVNACLILIEHGIKFQLRLAGKGGSFETALRSKAKENGWDWLEFLGKLSREEVYRNYIEADVCCFPSWWETMPMVCLESMALGAVIVSTKVGGIPEIITDGHDGFLCESRNPKALAETLEKALSLNKSERQNITTNSQATVAKRFNSDYISQRMLNYFENVIADYNKNMK